MNHTPKPALQLPLAALLLWMWALPCTAQVAPVPQGASGTAATAESPRAEWCGEVLTLATHDGSSTRYTFSAPVILAGRDKPAPVTLLLLAGGSGHAELNERGCPRALRGNSVVRAIPGLNVAGIGTALMDAPSDFQGEDGLAGFRTERKHADDLGALISALRERTGGTVWVAGASRGSISAVNAAARLAGAAAPDGVILVSPITSGQAGAKKRWVAQTVFDLPLESIRVPVLVVGHTEDQCVRSPPLRMGEITARTAGARKQVVLAKGGPGWSGPAGTAACDGRAPHSFFMLEEELAAGMARFVRGEPY